MSQPPLSLEHFEGRLPGHIQSLWPPTRPETDERPGLKYTEAGTHTVTRIIPCPQLLGCIIYISDLLQCIVGVQEHTGYTVYTEHHEQNIQHGVFWLSFPVYTLAPKHSFHHEKLLLSHAHSSFPALFLWTVIFVCSAVTYSTSVFPFLSFSVLVSLSRCHVKGFCWCSGIYAPWKKIRRQERMEIAVLKYADW